MKPPKNRKIAALGRVLLAEDDAVLAMALEAALLDGGASAVTVCPSMEATVRALEADKPF
jgi:hypothetical protein